MSIFLPKPEFEMIAPEPKIIKSWSDFNGERTEKYYLDNWENTLDIIRISDRELISEIWKESTIPEAISVLNSLGFNFKESEV